MPASPRLLIVSHTYSAPLNRAKLSALAQHFSLAALVPARWPDALFTLSDPGAQSEGYALHSLPVRLAGRLMYHHYPFRELAALVRQTRPDLVYVEEEPGSLAVWQLTRLKKRFGYRLAFFTWENNLRRAGFPGLERLNLQRCDGAIAGSAEAAGVLHRKGFRGPVCVTPQLGLDPEVFEPARAVELRQSLGLEGFVAGFIGRWVEAKGVWTLLHAVRDMPDVQLALVGGGPLGPAIESWMTDNHLESRLRLIASVPHEAIVQYLNALDVLVLPSLTTPTWKEQFGHVLIEAMACGVPVVGSNSGAIPDVIGEAGLVFPEGDVAALRAALTRLRDDAHECERLGAAGRARVLERFTHARIAAAHAEFLRSLLV
jgi:glycosyltransferase involved in cell wall biosynthesis